MLVFNNLNFGMTGGQHSPPPPRGRSRATTPGGNLEHPLDICGTVESTGPGTCTGGRPLTPIWRSESPRRSHPGFALLDIWEPCTAYFVPANKATRRSLEATIERLGFGRGVLFERPVEDYGTAYRAAAAGLRPAAGPTPIAVEHSSPLVAPLSLLVAGSAGAKVRSAASDRRGGDPQRGCGSQRRLPGHGKDRAQRLRGDAGADAPGAGRRGVPDVAVVASEDGLAKVRTLWGE